MGWFGSDRPHFTTNSTQSLDLSLVIHSNCLTKAHIPRSNTHQSLKKKGNMHTFTIRAVLACLLLKKGCGLPHIWPWRELPPVLGRVINSVLLWPVSVGTYWIWPKSERNTPSVKFPGKILAYSGHFETKQFRLYRLNSFFLFIILQISPFLGSSIEIEGENPFFRASLTGSSSKASAAASRRRMFLFPGTTLHALKNLSISFCFRN